MELAQLKAMNRPLIFSQRAKSTKRKKPRVVSLFAGCGGLDLGFIDAGFEIVWANDFDKNAVATYRHNIGDIDDRSIRDVQASEVPNADVILAGFPCQPFSSAGNRKGVKDERGTLFLDALRLIEDKQPKVIVFENVRGLLSTKNEDGSKLIDTIFHLLSKAGSGYHVEYRLVNASDYEVPQNRHRVILVGTRKDMDKPFVFPEKIEKKNLELRHVLKGLPKGDPNTKEHWELSPQSKKMIEFIPEGGSWKNIPDKHLPPRLKRIRKEIKRYKSPNFYRRFSRDEICGTITAAGTPENSGIVHPNQNRRYTVREIARVQSFPDWFRFDADSVASKYKVIGNAVPPRLAYHVAKAIREQIF